MEFLIPGDPVPKGRPRFTLNGRTYTPKKTTEYEALVKKCFQESGFEPFSEEVPLRVMIDMNFAMPKSWSNKKRSEMRWKPCLKRPDLDNCVKSITDALNGVAFYDDSQIAELITSKQWSDNGNAKVYINVIEE